jgi:hypothetical protein
VRSPVRTGLRLEISCSAGKYRDFHEFERSYATIGRTQISTAIRGHLGEFRKVAPIGRKGLAQLIGVVADRTTTHCPTMCALASRCS